MNVAIIGAGPAGLLAAWGAAYAGAEVRIFDPSPTSLPDRILGLQYLHELCELPVEKVRKLELRYRVEPQYNGIPFFEDPDIPEGRIYALSPATYYARRAYNFKLGRPLDEENSFKYVNTSAATAVHSLKDAYKFLHHQFRYDILQRSVTWKEIVVDLADDFDVVINTAPLDKLLPYWGWPTRDAWIQFTLPDGVEVPDGTCVYNLDPEVPWYRATHLDGAVSTEYLYAIADGMMDVPGRLLRKVVKTRLPGPLPLNVYLAGRWGSWDPQALTSDAFKVAREACK